MTETLNSNKKVSLRWRRTKIIATIGPATDSEKKIIELLKAGVNVFRINMSHGDHVYHRKMFKRVRYCATAMHTHVAILMDLCGPKIRTGQFRNGHIVLKKNEKVVIRCRAGTGDDGLIISQYKRLCHDVKTGERILLDDGNLECRVEYVEGHDIYCKVIYGGELKNNKGMNLPDSTITVSSFTEKDKRDVQLAMSLGTDFVALSFVRTAKDVERLKKYMQRTNKVIAIIAKIEKPEAVSDIDNIIASAHGVMIARGDLGIELPAEEVPLIQKQIINKARLYNRPVIVATQMMESMITNARPTRAEVGDVANAAMSSADAVMLSAETAVGKYPVKAVKIMDKVLREIEAYQWASGVFGDTLVECDNVPSSRKAISQAACRLAKDLQLQGILVPTRSGHTAEVLSAARPTSPLICASSNLTTCQKLALHWGVIPFSMNKKNVLDWKVFAQEVNDYYKLNRAGNRVLLVSGFNDDEALNEPVLKIIRVRSKP